MLDQISCYVQFNFQWFQFHQRSHSCSLLFLFNLISGISTASLQWETGRLVLNPPCECYWLCTVNLCPVFMGFFQRIYSHDIIISHTDFFIFFAPVLNLLRNLRGVLHLVQKLNLKYHKNRLLRSARTTSESFMYVVCAYYFLLFSPINLCCTYFIQNIFYTKSCTSFLLILLARSAVCSDCVINFSDSTH